MAYVYTVDYSSAMKRHPALCHTRTHTAGVMLALKMLTRVMLTRTNIEGGYAITQTDKEEHSLISHVESKIMELRSRE